MTAPLDGNAAAGALREIFSVDLTTAVGRCVGCGSANELARALMYDTAPGLVLRCPECEAVVARVVRGPNRAWLDLRGISYLQIELPTD